MPAAAKKKMQLAKKKKQTVYIYGATCYGKTEFVKQFLEFRNYLYFSCKDSRQLLLNVNAFRCMLHLYENNQDAIQEWIKEAPDENETFFVMERYRYLIKIRCYILQAEYVKGLSLLELLKYYAGQCSRPYLSMEA